MTYQNLRADMLSPCLILGYQTDSLHIWHKHNTWGDGVWCTIPMSKGQKSRSQQSLEILPVSAVWLGSGFSNLLYMWHEYIAWRDDVSCTVFRSTVKIQCLTDSSSFCSWVVLIWPIRSICGTYTTNQGTIYSAASVSIRLIDFICGSYIRAFLNT